jgi:hypothetical protein
MEDEAKGWIGGTSGGKRKRLSERVNVAWEEENGGETRRV